VVDDEYLRCLTGAELCLESQSKMDEDCCAVAGIGTGIRGAVQRARQAHLNKVPEKVIWWDD